MATAAAGLPGGRPARHMAAMAMDAALLDFLAAFAGAFTAPSLAALVLLAGLAAGSRPRRARAAALGLGLAHGALEWALDLRPTDALPLLLGSMAAGWLLVELVLQLVLPALRLARRILQAIAGILVGRG